MKKIQFLFTGNFEIDGRDRHFEKDETLDASDKDADRLIVGLCAVEVVDDQSTFKFAGGPTGIKFSEYDGKESFVPHPRKSRKQEVE